MNRFARDISDLELDDYQRTMRMVLRHPLITARFPDDKSLNRVRRFAASLRRDLAEAFGYRLETHGTTMRLVRAKDLVDGTQPIRSRTDRPFDRQRYAYLMLCLAVLGRCGIQTTVSELADMVAADANRIAGLGMDVDRHADRRAFVDAVGWLEDRGAVATAEGSSQAWVTDSRTGEALLDIERDVVLALFRPPRTVQAVSGVMGLMDQSMATSGNEQRRLAAQRARRAVAEQPVVYFRDVDDAIANHLRGTALAEDMQRLMGLRLERRAEGVLLVDTTAGFSVERFPSTGAAAQAAILLLVELCDRINDPDRPQIQQIAAPSRADRQAAIAAAVDVGLPAATQIVLAADDQSPATMDSSGEQQRLPFVTDSFLNDTVVAILSRYPKSFGADWRADPQRLCAEAVGLLERFGCVQTIPGGVLVLPLAGRYRNTVAQAKTRPTAPRLF